MDIIYAFHRPNLLRRNPIALTAHFVRQNKMACVQSVRDVVKHFEQCWLYVDMFPRMLNIKNTRFDTHGASCIRCTGVGIYYICMCAREKERGGKGWRADSEGARERESERPRTGADTQGASQ